MDFWISFANFFASAIRLTAPIALGTLACTISERAGVINIGIEGSMLFSGFLAAVGAYYMGSPWVGLLCGCAAGAFLALILGVLAIYCNGQQIVIGVGLNLFGPGFAYMLMRALWDTTGISPWVEGFQAFVRNLMTIDRPGLTLMQWLDDIYKVFVRIDGDVIFYASAACMADLIKHGCTCSVDHQYCYTPATGKQGVDRQMEAARLMGFRFVAARGTNTLPRWKGSTIPDEMCETTAEYLDDCQRLLALYHDPEPFSMRQIVLAPCQPINCTEETFLETIRLARSAGVHMHTHLCEGENSSMVRRFGVRSLEWCRRIGFVGSDIWLAHGRETLPEEYALLAENHMGISHCPAPTMLGGSEILDIPGMRKAGIPISLGVDGCATNDGSNMLDTLRLAYLMQTFLSKKRGGCPSPYEMLKLATVGGR